MHHRFFRLFRVPEDPTHEIALRLTREDSDQPLLSRVESQLVKSAGRTGKSEFDLLFLKIEKLDGLSRITIPAPKEAGIEIEGNAAVIPKCSPNPISFAR